MIVVCPSCGTSFRHQVVAGEGSRHGRCSRCSSTFPLATRPSYRVEPTVATVWRAAPACDFGAMPVPVAAASARPSGRPAVPEGRRAPSLAFGMDDPALLSSLGTTALDATAGLPRRAMTYWVVAEEAGREAPAGPRRRGAPAEALASPAGGTATDHRLAVSASLGALAFGSAGFGIASWAGWPAREAALCGAGLGMLLAWGISRWKARLL